MYFKKFGLLSDFILKISIIKTVDVQFIYVYKGTSFLCFSFCFKYQKKYENIKKTAYVQA